MSSATGIVESNESRVQGKQGPWRGFEESKGFMYLLLTPILVFFIVLNVIPTMWMIGLSFYQYSLMSAAPPSFIGLDNYIKIYNDADLWSAFGRTFLFVVLAVGIETVLGLAWAFCSGAAPTCRAAAWR